jgi:hypothetical protein
LCRPSAVLPYSVEVRSDDIQVADRPLRSLDRAGDTQPDGVPPDRELERAGTDQDPRCGGVRPFGVVPVVLDTGNVVGST